MSGDMHMMKLIAPLLLIPSIVAAQSVPNGTITPNQVWTPLEWNNAFQSKQDYPIPPASITASMLTPSIIPVTQRAPTANDDTVHGYAIGDLWNATGHVYQALQVGAGRATWQQLSTPALLLDQVGGAIPVAAYGTMQVRASYTGKLFNVVRASDGAALDIGSLSGGGADVPTFNAFCAPTICRLATWYDQSGQGTVNPAVGVGGTTKPLVVARGSQIHIVWDTEPIGTGLVEGLMLPSGVAVTGSASVFVLGSVYNSSSDRALALVTLGTSSPYTLATSENGPGLGVVAIGCGNLSFGGTFPSFSRSIYGFTFGAVNAGYNGSPVSIHSIAACTVPSLTGGLIGYNGVSGSGYMEADAVLIWPRGLAAADVNNLYTAGTFEFGLFPQAKSVFIDDGDSITEGIYATGLNNRLRQDDALFPRPTTIYDVGVSGIASSALITKFAADVLPEYRPGANNIYSVDVGTNDNDGTDPTCAVVGARLSTIVSMAHAGGFKVIIGTWLPRLGWSTAQNTEAAACNAFMRAGVGADAVADYANDPTIGFGGSGNYAAGSNIYTTDGTHPTPLGYAFMAQIEMAAAAPLMQ